MKTHNSEFTGAFKNSRGFILITAYLLMAQLSVVALGTFGWSSQFLQASERNKKKIVAFNFAEAGFDDAYYRVKNNQVTGYPWSSGYVSMTSGSVEGGYSTTVTDMGNNIRKISVTGYSPSQTSSSTVAVESRTVVGYMSAGSGNPFGYAAFGSEEVTVNGNATIDSYDASSGAYGGSNVSSGGTVGTNATGAGKLSLQGSSLVKGNLLSGFGSDPNSVITISGSASKTGTKDSLSAVKDMSLKTTSIASSGSLDLNGKTVYTMAAGTYRFDSIKINGSARVNATGAVTIYCDGEITLNGNGVTTSANNPSNMIIYGTSAAKVTLNGTSDFYGGIYAPLAEFEVNGTTNVYGSVIGRDLEINGNAKIHFDQSLGGSNQTTGMLSWSESNLSNS